MSKRSLLRQCVLFCNWLCDYVKVCSGELILRMGQTRQQILADLGGLACSLCDRNDRTHFLGTINLEGYSWHTSAPLLINFCGDYEYEFFPQNGASSTVKEG